MQAILLQISLLPDQFGGLLIALYLALTSIA